MRRTLLVLTLFLPACMGDAADTKMSAVAPSTSTPPAVEEVEDTEPFGLGSWSAARTVAGKPNELLVFVVGGPKYEADDPCSVRYEPRVTETADEVALSFAAFSPKTTSNFGCDDMGHFRTIPVTLQSPLGSRRLRDVQFKRVQPVWDGNRLYEPTWLPDGFKLLTEDSDHDKLAYWIRTYAAERSIVDGACAPGPQSLEVFQSAPKLLQPYPGAREVQVRGTRGQFEGSEPDGKTLSWNEAGQGFQVGSRAGCAGDPPTADEVLLRFAEGLRKPQ